MKQKKKINEFLDDYPTQSNDNHIKSGILTPVNDETKRLNMMMLVSDNVSPTSKPITGGISQ